jgi:hypothetical protein|tara:strand:- start:297 stop:689 length:393 start_codon:yes stop_codon:yes gene_type:complete
MKKKDNPFLNGDVVLDPYPKTKGLKKRLKMCKKLEENMRDTTYSKPSTRETHLYNYMVQSLVDRGLADSRAVKIVKALEKNDMSALAFSVCACDEANFPHLLKIEPRIFHMLLWDREDPVLIKRLEEVCK